MSDPITEHYERVATRYDEHWTYDPDYVARLSRSVLDALRLTAGDAIADVGCGTGLYARELARELRPTRPLLCVDPVAAMLDQVPVSPGLRRLQASAEDLASGRVPLPEPMDAIILKESVHHLAAWRETLAGLTTLLSRRGRVLVVMLPTVIEHPLFRAAHELFRDRQPEPSAVEGALTAAGLRASTSYRTFHVAIERDRYVRMLEERYMSVLSDFSEAELNAGIDQFRAAYRDPVLRFDDRFALVSGWVAHH